MFHERRFFPIVRTATRRWTRVLGAALAVSITFQPAIAHLSLIRQGEESRGAREPGDYFGWASAAGDFDDDGYNDLAVGSPHDEQGDYPDTRHHGFVTINYGSPTGLTHAGADKLSIDPSWEDDTSIEMGRVLAAGDFDGDGADDLAVALPFVNTNDGMGSTFNNGGAVLIYPGIAGIGISPNASAALVGAFQADERFGWALAVGDFDDDGYEDLAVGGPGRDGRQGGVSVFYGNASGLRWDDPRRTEFSASDWLSAPPADSEFGAKLAAGHVMGDPSDDLIIGAPHMTVIGLANEGRIFLTEGGPGGLDTSPSDWHTAVDLWPGAPPQSNAYFGWSLAVGNFTDDESGYRSLVIGEPWRDVGTKDNAGQVYVADGSFTGLRESSVLRLTQSDVDGTPGTDELFGYAVAAGRFTVGPYDDLAISAPGQNLASVVNSGHVHVLYGNATGLDVASHITYNTKKIDYQAWNDQRLGMSLTFGRFDNNAGSRAGLAIGAPNHDGYSGIVYALLPWRQPEQHRCVTSMARDCENTIVYSRRLFEEVQIASTTKIMTALLACEMIEDGLADLSDVYLVPSWAANNIAGTTSPLVAGEFLSLETLLILTMSESDNDASYAVADLLTGGDATWSDHYGTTKDFVDMMNARAATAGLDHTYFTNPAGLDIQDTDGTYPYSCAFDMLKLTRIAMQHDIFRDLVGTASWTVVRLGGLATVDTFYLTSQQSWFPMAIGVKGGTTGRAGRCGVSSGVDVLGGGEFYSDVFGTLNDVSSRRYQEAADLLAIARSACAGDEDDVEWPLQIPPSPVASELDSIPSFAGERRCLSAQLETDPAQFPDQTLIELHRRGDSADPIASFAIDVRLQSDLVLAPEATATVGITGALGAGGLRISNPTDQPAELLLEFSFPEGYQEVAFVEPWGFYQTASYPGDGSPHDFMATIHNISPVTARVTVEEVGYEFLADLTVPDPTWSTELLRGGPAQGSVTVCVQGIDPEGTENGHLVIRQPGGLLETDEPGISSEPPAGRLVAMPNPFHASTRLRFQTTRTGDATLDVYDVSGRLVGRADLGRIDVGLHEVVWDGRDATGNAAPSGVYFARLRLDGEPIASVKLLLRR